MIKSLHVLNHSLAHSENQLAILEGGKAAGIASFREKLATEGLMPLRSSKIEIFQVNIGRMCNQTCKHCHVDAGPDRREIMTLETMKMCLRVLTDSKISTVDITGGAPELNPNFRWFVEEIKKLGKHIIVRCNLTIILANKRFNDLPEFFRQLGIEVVSSLPSITANRTDRQRGTGVFQDSIKALKMLNAVGYGQEGSGLILNLVYNPAGAFLPPSQLALEREFKEELFKSYGISFNHLFAITNMPISRYLDYLLESLNYNQYMQKLVSSFNPAAIENLMCRNTISVGWDGMIYDCDFNQMLDLSVSVEGTQHISSFDENLLCTRDIVVRQHCFGCTAGAGSSCGGAIV